MLTSYQLRREEARRRAEEKFSKVQRVEIARSDRQNTYADVVAKMARLRTLRLTKEYSDRDAAAQASAERAQLKAKRLTRTANATNRRPVTEEAESTRDR